MTTPSGEDVVARADENFDVPIANNDAIVAGEGGYLARSASAAFEGVVTTEEDVALDATVVDDDVMGSGDTAVDVANDGPMIVKGKRATIECLDSVEVPLIIPVAPLVIDVEKLLTSTPIWSDLMAPKLLMLFAGWVEDTNTPSNSPEIDP